jgi:DNA-binding Lrp family transcriptional regulator
MSEATNRMDLAMFAHAVNLSPNQAIAAVQELAQEGFLRKVGAGYGLTDKGKNVIKIGNTVEGDKAFNFYMGVDKPLGFSAHSLEEFYRIIKQVYSDALDFHLYRGDFENWIRQVIGDDVLADEIARLKTSGLNGEALRKALLQAIDELYGVGELL